MSLEELFPGLTELERVRRRGARMLNEVLQDEADLRKRQRPPSGPARKAAPPRLKKAPTASPLDDEPRRKRSGGGGGAASAPVRRPVPSPRPAAKSPPAASGGRASAAPVKAGLATGAQSAVVKIASYAGGGSRVGALMAYQSHDGETDLEHSDGRQIAGPDEVRQLASEWTAEAAHREPSKDVLRVRLQVDGSQSEAAIREALAESLDGHRYAWRAEREWERTTVLVALSAASKARDESGKALRVYDNAKSLTALEGRLADRFGPTLRFEAQGFAHGIEGAARYLSHLTKRGELPAETEAGKPLVGHQANLDTAKSWKRYLRSREARDVAHVIISAKPGTDRTAFVGASRATLDRSFPDREYVFALHENRAHLHVHAVVKMVDSRGQRMDPNIHDLRRWRETMAQEARQRGIAMEAPSRFEQANPPGFKLKDIRRVERGVASEATRRRVEAVRQRAVHVPTRPEGRARAKSVAEQWRQLAAGSLVEPAQAAGTTRFYRVERADVSPADGARGMLFTRERAHAASLVKPDTRLVFVDVPANRLAEVQAARLEPQRMVVMPIALAESRVTLVEAGEASTGLRQLRTRTAEAVVRMNARESGKSPSAQDTERAEPVASAVGPAQPPADAGSQRDAAKPERPTEKPRGRIQKH